MSDPRIRAAAGEFCELWTNATKLYQRVPGEAASPAGRGLGNRSTRVFEISDIANRIAPKNIQPKEKESPLLQWIDDGTIPCTPEIQKPRVRKKSSRQSSVEDLMKLARQFDQNMQQDEETLEQLNIINNNLCESVKTCETKVTSAALTSDVKDPSPSDQVEAELHALFDCSTQTVSGKSSEGSVCSPEIKARPGTSALAEHQPTELKSTDKCHLAALPAKQHGTCSNTINSCNDYDDDWENDDLLNDSFVLAVTQNPDVHLSDTLKTTFHSKNKPNTTQFASVFKQTTNTDSNLQLSDLHCKTSCSALQELCPKPKTTNRSTFKLARNPHFQPRMSEEVSKPNFTVIQPKSKMTTTKTCPESQGSQETRNQAGSVLKSTSVKDISDSLWDDGDDDALLYQVCDTVERISNSQPRQTSSSICRENQDFAAGRQQPGDAAWCINSAASAKRQPSCSFVRSNSLPATSCEKGNYKGWNIPMKGSNNKSRMSQSFPGSGVDQATFGQCRDFSGKVQDGNAHVEGKAHTVAAGTPQKPHLSAFKRNLSDSAIISNKVFVTSQKPGKCSAAEIERKKQEALARRRLRMQSASKPS
ncbi:uncharacterized protein etaa1b [Xenentodon cancila]